MYNMCYVYMLSVHCCGIELICGKEPPIFWIAGGDSPELTTVMGPRVEKIKTKQGN